MFKTKQIIVMAAFCLNFSAFSQSHTNNIKPLKIGDTIPEALWNTPLQVVNHPEGKKTITLNDYRGKLIILDFMNTRCTSCIQKLFLFDSLQKKNNSQVQFIIITTENQEKVNSFLKNNKIGKYLSLQIVFQDSFLKKIYPHQFISHIAWQYLNLVKAITPAKYVTEKNIKMVLNDETINWPVKNDFPQEQSLKAAVQPKL